MGDMAGTGVAFILLVLVLAFVIAGSDGDSYDNFD